MARLKLKLWDSVIADCKACLELSPDNMKAFYYLSQAKSALGDFDGALEDALRAYDLCVVSGDRSLASVTAQVLRCKKDRWDHMEKRRTHEASDLEVLVEQLMEKERDQVLRDTVDDGERREIADEWEHKIVHMRSIFTKARPAAEKERKVPDWAIDDISFGFMLDPVIVSPSRILHSNPTCND